MKKITHKHYKSSEILKDGYSIYKYANKHHIEDYYINNLDSISSPNLLECWKYKGIGIQTDDGKYHILSNDNDIDKFNKMYD